MSAGCSESHQMVRGAKGPNRGMSAATVADSPPICQTSQVEKALTLDPVGTDRPEGSPGGEKPLWFRLIYFA